MNARDRLNAYVTHESDADQAEFNARLDAFRAEVRAEVLGSDLNPSNLVLDAQAYRQLADAITATMTDPERWDGDDDEGTILARYVKWLAHEREAAAPADFFQPGRTYTRNLPFAAPEVCPSFQCVAVAEHPTRGTRRALGFERQGANAPWASSSLRDEEWADGWVEAAASQYDEEADA